MKTREAFDPVLIIHRDHRKAPRKQRLSELDYIDTHEIESRDEGVQIRDFLARSLDWGYCFTHQRWERWKEESHEPARKTG